MGNVALCRPHMGWAQIVAQGGTIITWNTHQGQTSGETFNFKAKKCDT